jgi:cysteine desulfurase/selenocysteine lyase
MPNESIDVTTVRADTPACERVLHFNNAGAALMPDPVYRVLVEHLELERRVGGYEAQAIAADAVDAFYSEFAELLGCEENEIAYIENATRAWDMAFYSVPLSEGDRVLTHAAEYASNYLALLQQAQRKGFTIDVAPSDASGQVDLEALEQMIRPQTRLIALTHVPTQGGLVNPAEEVGAIARRHDVMYLLDACQSAGQLELDVSRLQCDLLTGTGRKFLRGPRGTGFLYVSRRVVGQLEPPFIDMRAATWTATGEYEYAPGARRFETWESYVAGRIALAEAVSYARGLGIAAIEMRVTGLAARLREALGSVPGVQVHDRGERRCGIVTFVKHGEAPESTVARLGRAGINVSMTVRTSAQIDFGERGLDALVRASVHYYNTAEEIERFVSAVAGDG